MKDSPAQIELAEAGRRIATIAIVHDLLAHNPGEAVDFDEVVGRVIPLSIETATTGEVKTEFAGSFGILPSDTATTLALVLAELVANSVEHALAGRDQVAISITAIRDNDHIEVAICDDGPGMPKPQTESRGLGLAIVNTLIAEELSGSIQFAEVIPNSELPGTRALVKFSINR